ncbi:hypothetical protein [Pseudomonas syringae]|uniref:hypothetical protein n=1 Tax=Pseudomonas syringae TaxID=317 RepID=UPI0012AEB41C|nr:hypothetical protein [Pseudomonas syringae]
MSLLAKASDEFPLARACTGSRAFFYLDSGSPIINRPDIRYAQPSFFNSALFRDSVGLETHHGVTTMATAILHSIKQGAYIAISLYVVFIAVVTVTSMNPQLTTPSTQTLVERTAVNVQERAS